MQRLAVYTGEALDELEAVFVGICTTLAALNGLRTTRIHDIPASAFVTFTWSRYW